MSVDPLLPPLAHLTLERLQTDGLKKEILEGKSDNRHMLKTFSEYVPPKESAQIRLSNTCWEVGRVLANETAVWSDGQGRVKIPANLFISPDDRSDDHAEWRYNMAEMPLIQTGSMTVGTLAGSPAHIEWCTVRARDASFHINTRQGSDTLSEDLTLGRFREAMNPKPQGGERNGFNLYNANLYMAVVVVDLFKATHMIRGCGCILFSNDPAKMNTRLEYETLQEHAAIAVETVLGTCPFLDVSREITGGPEYKTPLQRHLDDEQTAMMP